MNKTLILLLCTITSSCLFAQTEHMVLPNIADPLSSAPNNNHYIYINQTVTQKNKLFLFFPGTGAVAFNYKLILKHAANLGYHSIGLTYPNAIAINDFCSTSTDTTCHSRARLEVFDGVDRHADVTVDSLNSIMRRTLKLLQYLTANFPWENWGQYYSGNTILWDRVIVSGHSQGGGHAGIISKVKEVDRVAMFAATDWMIASGRFADWITWPGVTPQDRYFGFIHEDDEAVNFTLELATWDAYGMDEYGSEVLTDTAPIPFNGSHKLYTRITPANDPAKFHGSVVADAYTPLSGGEPVFKDVWTYMIDINPMLSLYDKETSDDLQVYPNPFTEKIIVTIASGKHKYQLINVLGEVISNGELKKEIQISTSLKPGVYFLRVYDSKTSTVRKLVKE